MYVKKYTHTHTHGHTKQKCYTVPRTYMYLLSPAEGRSLSMASSRPLSLSRALTNGALLSWFAW